MVPSGAYPNCEFELTVSGKTYTTWNTATEEIELKQDAEVILKLWNADRYQEGNATLQITYKAPETTEPSEPDNGGSGNTEGSDNSGNTDNSDGTI